MQKTLSHPAKPWTTIPKSYTRAYEVWLGWPSGTRSLLPFGSVAHHGLRDVGSKVHGLGFRFEGLRSHESELKQGLGFSSSLHNHFTTHTLAHTLSKPWKNMFSAA